MPDSISDNDGQIKFDWSDDSSLIIPRQTAIAVYENNAGDCVIRAEQQWDDERDSVIIVAKKNLPDLISALNSILKNGGLK